jgi:hypothetical protein
MAHEMPLEIAVPPQVTSADCWWAPVAHKVGAFHQGYSNFAVRMQEDIFSVLAQTLTNEYLTLEYFRRMLEETAVTPPGDGPRQRAREIRQAISDAKSGIQRAFSTDTNAEENWNKLAAYATFVRENPGSTPDTTAPAGLAEQGRSLANNVFKARKIRNDYNAYQQQLAGGFLHNNVYSTHVICAAVAQRTCDLQHTRDLQHACGLHSCCSPHHSFPVFGWDNSCGFH